MAVTPNIATLPPPSVPFLDQTGYVSKAWYYFLLALLNRTGATPIPINIAKLQEQVVSLFVEEAMNDVPASAPFPAFSFDTVLSDSQSQPYTSVLLPLALADDQQHSSVNPFLASLMVSDPT